MTVFCVDHSPIALFALNGKVKKIIPEASIVSCRTPEDAILTAKQKKCDVLITEIDFGRRKEEGISLAEEIKRFNPFVNIIFIASGLSREYAMRLMKLRYSGYLTKPFSVNELKEELNNLRY